MVELCVVPGYSPGAGFDTHSGWEAWVEGAALVMSGGPF